MIRVETSTYLGSAKEDQLTIYEVDADRLAFHSDAGVVVLSLQKEQSSGAYVTVAMFQNWDAAYLDGTTTILRTPRKAPEPQDAS